MKGQLSHSEFCSLHPNANVYLVNEQLFATTRYGKCTLNHWIQHSDGTWTNYKSQTTS